MSNFSVLFVGILSISLIVHWVNDLLDFLSDRVSRFIFKRYMFPKLVKKFKSGVFTQDEVVYVLFNIFPYEMGVEKLSYYTSVLKDSFDSSFSSFNEEFSFKKRDSCFGCDCWDSDREGCTMPSCDKSYACSLENDESFTYCDMED